MTHLCTLQIPCDVFPSFDLQVSVLEYYWALGSFSISHLLNNIQNIEESNRYKRPEKPLCIIASINRISAQFISDTKIRIYEYATLDYHISFKSGNW